MGLFDKAKAMASQAASQAVDGLVALGEEAEKEERIFGKRVDSVKGENGERMTLYRGGIEFECKDSEMNPGKRPWSDIVSISIDDAEQLRERVTVTRLLLVGVFAFALKKKKGGTKFVAVEGEDFFWAMEVGRKDVKDAQKLVIKAKSLLKQN